jgi:hypothetical protein
MSTEHRKQATINFEGQTLAFAGQYGLAIGREHAQCVIDGAANALARMDGAKDAAMYLYAVADRITGGVREPTALPAALLPAPKPVPLILAIEELDPPPPRRVPTAVVALVLLAFFVAGVVVAALVR